jgi:hypothetical protein
MGCFSGTFSFDKDGTLTDEQIYSWCNFEDAIFWGEKIDDMVATFNPFSSIITTFQVSWLIILFVIFTCSFIRIWCNINLPDHDYTHVLPTGLVPTT